MKTRIKICGITSVQDIAEAIAVSAAFPGGIGPLVIKMNKHTWKKRKNWDDREGSEIKITPVTVSKNELAYIFFTSGTTGEPTGPYPATRSDPDLF